MHISSLPGVRVGLFLLLACLWSIACGGRSAIAGVADLGVTDQEYAGGGTTFQATSANLGAVGDLDVAPEFRYAMQFNLSSLPAGATITIAQLGLADNGPYAGQTFVISGFSGNGSFGNGTINSATDLQTIDPTNGSFDFYNVTAFVQGLASGSEAGFALRGDGAPSNVVEFGNTGGGEAPVLQLTYSVPEPGVMALGGLWLAGALLRRRRCTTRRRPG